MSIEARLNAALVALTVSLLFAIAARPASARDSMSPSLALARICASESSLPRLDDGVWVSQRRGVEWGRDCIAIHEALLNGAERHGMRYTAFARAYSGRVFDGSAWVADLQLDAREPRNWPLHSSRTVGDRVLLTPHAPWAAYRSAWRHVLRTAERIVERDLDDRDEWSVCAETVTDWGSDEDHARVERERRRLREVDCGNTANHFYTRAR